MPIQKRAVPKKPRKKLVKVHPDTIRHRKLCDSFYNRLQADLDDGSFMCLLREITGKELDAYLYIETIMARTDCEVVTLQINNNRDMFRCTMTYTDMAAKPKHGWLYPRMAVVKTSTRLIHSVMLSYVSLCKHIGRFI